MSANRGTEFVNYYDSDEYIYYITITIMNTLQLHYITIMNTFTKLSVRGLIA